MASHSEIKLAAWDDRAASDLRRIAAFSEDEIDVIAGKITRKAFQLFSVSVRGHRVGSLVLGVETDADGVLVLTVAALACQQVAGVKMRDLVVDWLKVTAGEIGAGRLRCWTARQGLARVLTTYGWKQKFILECDLGEH